MAAIARLVLALALAAAAAGSTLAAGPIRGVVEVAGKLAPLPPGRWIVVGEAVERHGEDLFAARALARIEAGAVEAVAIVRANLSGRPAAFTGPGECARNDLHLAHVAYDSAVDGLCLFVNHVVLSDAVAGPPVWLAARERLAELGATVTDTWLAVGIRARTSRHVVDARYYFAPPDFRGAMPARGWVDNRWAPARMAGDPDRRASIGRLGVWAIWAREAVELGLRGDIPEAALPPGPWDGPDLADRLVRHRIGHLDRLLAAGHIGEDEFRRQRRQAATVGLALGESAPPLWRRGWWDRIGHGAASVVESLGVGYLVIGSLWPSLGFGTLLEAAGPLGSYLQGLLWSEREGVETIPPTAPRDFAEIGQNG